MLGVASEQLQDLLHAKLACTGLTAFYRLICEFSLLLLEI